MMVENSTRGFTLIEMLVVVAIAGILVAVAYPSYQLQILKTRRADAKAALLEISQQLERCYTTFRIYNSPNCAVVTVVSSVPVVSQVSASGYYQIASTVLTAESYTLQATAQGLQANDTTCTKFTYTNTEVQGALNSYNVSQTSGCW